MSVNKLLSVVGYLNSQNSGHFDQREKSKNFKSSTSTKLLKIIQKKLDKFIILSTFVTQNPLWVNYENDM